MNIGLGLGLESGLGLGLVGTTFEQTEGKHFKCSYLCHFLSDHHDQECVGKVMELSFQ